jgi:hypothetical protein
LSLRKRKKLWIDLKNRPTEKASPYPSSKRILRHSGRTGGHPGSHKSGSPFDFSLKSGYSIRHVKRLKLLLAISATVALASSVFAGAIPDSWTQDKLDKRFPGSFLSKENGHLSVSFKKVAPHHFHGGECFVLFTELLRGPEGREIQGDDASISISQTGSDISWFDRVTGFSVSTVTNPKTFATYYKASKNGNVYATGRLKGNTLENWFIVSNTN